MMSSNTTTILHIIIAISFNYSRVIRNDDTASETKTLTSVA